AGSSTSFASRPPLRMTLFLVDDTVYCLLLVVVAGESAVYGEGGAVDVGCSVGGEEGYEAGDIIGGSEAAERDLREEGVELGLIFEQRLVDGRTMGPGRVVFSGSAGRPSVAGGVA